jgi:hypothetical protein
MLTCFCVAQSARICGIDEEPMFQRMKLSLHMPKFEFKVLSIHLASEPPPIPSHDLSLPKEFGISCQRMQINGSAARLRNQEALQLASPVPKAFAPSRAERADQHDSWPGGSVWCRDQQEVLRSFTTCISFVFPVGSNTAGIAFVIQNQVIYTPFFCFWALPLTWCCRVQLR